jgi:hypothetical protein
MAPSSGPKPCKKKAKIIAFLLGLLSYLIDGGSTFVRNVREIKSDCTALYLRRNDILHGHDCENSRFLCYVLLFE